MDTFVIGFTEGNAGKEEKMTHQDILIIGGGAAGFFTAINVAEMNPGAKIRILERGNDVLTKVRISGGGRCNVTHAEFVPGELAKNYPRGEKELRGPFHSFMTGDTITWFEDHGVELKIEQDGRMFPVSDSSETIINCFLKETQRLDIDVLRKQAVQSIEQKKGKWEVLTKSSVFTAEKLVVATGSNPKIWNLLEKLGHSIVPPVPSLFTFNITDSRIKDLSGISAQALVKVSGKKLESQGPLLITHWGMSGPAILKLSAWGARELSELPEFEIVVNWLGDTVSEDVLNSLKELRYKNARQLILKGTQLGLPRRLWLNLGKAAGVTQDLRWADLSKTTLSAMVSQLTSCVLQVHGKSTFKEEFVTAGGVDLKEVDFKTFQSRHLDNLFFAGEILNIDAITGGFNFQNAWTGGYIVAKAITASEP